MAWQLLLVEDEASVREAFALRLTAQGYLVQTAGSGEDALTLLRSDRKSTRLNSSHQ